MDDNNIQHHTSNTDQISYLMASSTAAAANSDNTLSGFGTAIHHMEIRPMSFSALAMHGAHIPFHAGGRPSGFDPASLLHGVHQLDSNSDSEEGSVELAEEVAKPTTSRGGSGSKRSRAAEVHNMSEKRRRSRINEKMKALQKLIPNSNKTDKASMLDEAIDYLKQLQLQVQMLSMKNGLNLHPMYVSGALRPLNVSQTGLSYGGVDASAINMGMNELPANSFDLPNMKISAYQSIVPSFSNINDRIAAFTTQSSQSRQGTSYLPVALEGAAHTQVMGPDKQLDLDRGAHPEIKLGSHVSPTSVPFNCYPSLLTHITNHVEAPTEILQDEIPKDQYKAILMQHMHHLQRELSHSSGEF